MALFYPITVTTSGHVSLTLADDSPPRPAPQQEDSGGGGSDPPPPPPKQALYVGVLAEGDLVEQRRAFVRFKIDDLPGAVTSARLEWFYIDRAVPTGNVSLIEVIDPGLIGAEDWGVEERATITTSFLTPSTAQATKLNIDVTTRYNQAKTDGLSIFALKLQYATETEGVGIGRWYRLGATADIAPVLVLTVTAGSDARMVLIATQIAVDLNRLDGLGTPAAVITAGDGATYPPLGNDVRLAASIDGLVDDALGTYTGTARAPIRQGPDIIRFLWQSATEGIGLANAVVDIAAFLVARARLADWFPLAGGLTEVRDAREWVARIARSCRSFAYLDQNGRESLYTAPTGGSAQTPVRLVRPWEHGPIRLIPLPSATGAQWPVARVDVSYGLDYLGLMGWQSHALIAAGETDPTDTARDRQAVAALARYGPREAGGVAAAVDPSTGYEFVPADVPGTPTGVRIRNTLWDQAQARPQPVQAFEVSLPRFALSWRLLDEFQFESYAFPSEAGRMPLSMTPFTDDVESGADAYQARRARCSVRELPRFTAESGPEFPVLITAQIIVWETA